MSSITLENAVGGLNELGWDAPDVVWTYAGHLRVTGWRTADRDALSTTDGPGTWYEVDAVGDLTRATFSPSRLAGRDRCFSYQIDVERFAGDADLDAMFRLPACAPSVGPPAGQAPPGPPASTVPEAGALLLVSLGLALLGAWVRVLR